MNVFKSKIDKGLLICLVLSIIACVLGASVMLKVGGLFNYVLAAVTLIAGAGFPLQILISTKYILKNESLDIISGPFSWKIPIESITSVQEVQNALMSPALSFDRLEIKYGEDKVIMVSPANKKAFMQTLDDMKSTGTDEHTQPQTIDKSSKGNKKIKKKPKNA
ncbi:PH domain-containing protein [Nitrosomonas aestuarii]|uniref:PH domain-containing protein n=1 Tax=Nitrosomonas aestuarii TaxID=52441 RepID=A0A1I4CUP4_9PROT|nr:PH domain-containing protein [Nitrosomonas aestuarii]SFK84340.1 PH domain-containing protein [Nitrosomonas aestuarii]